MVDWRQIKNNPVFLENLGKRAQILAKIRNFFEKRSFLEIQTPLLAPYLIPESYLEVFETEFKNKTGKKQRAFLATSPEMWLKKLLVAGVGNCFEITKSFRNSELSGFLHAPEFTILEWYRLGGSLEETMADCQDLIRELNNQKPYFSYRGKRLDIEKPFLRISVRESFQKWLNINQEDFFSKEALLFAALERGYQGSKKDSWEEIFNWLYVSEIEPHLGSEEPTFIYDFPGQLAPLAKSKKEETGFKERFELYLFGIELADAYNELNDWQEQKGLLEKEKKQRQKKGAIDYPSDRDFLEALKEGLPDSSGVALGVDRLVMIFCNASSIHEVTAFSGEDLWLS